ncbi:MAG: hypothetical protein AAF358_21525 [Pseudomonadota bacterium]
MSIFEHISVFLSIILGLAIVHLLGGLSLILDRRVQARVYWVHLLWVANLLFVSVLVWLGNFVLSDVEVFSVWHFLNLVAYCMVIYLMSGLLFPVRGGEVTDFRAHFEANRVRFFSLGLLFVLTDIVDGLLEHLAIGLPLAPGQFITLGLEFVLFVGGLKTASERYHGAVAVLFCLGSIGWLVSLVMIGVVTT